MKISILVPEKSVMEAISPPYRLFSMANDFLKAADNGFQFDVEFVGMKKEVQIQEGIYSIRVNRLLSEVSNTDLLIVPALFGDMKTAIEANKEVVPYIQKMYAQGSQVASLCLGSFLLAATGILDGKQSSTHWAYYKEFKEMFPEVKVVEGSIITDEGKIYSSGGANSIWNLLLYLLEKFTNRDTAIIASKYFAIDIDRESQNKFTMFVGQRNHNDDSIKEIQDLIENNIAEKLSVDQLAHSASIGRRSFERRFKSATGNSIHEYIQRVKIEAAKRSFESSRKNVNEIMYDVGYTDTKSFRDLFKKITGLTPIEYRNKYSKMIVDYTN